MKMQSIEDAVRDGRLKDRWRKLDMLFAAIGAEIGSLLIIALALAILCAPVGIGLGATWLLASAVARATHTVFFGWVTAILLFGFFCRYIWGSRLQAASRRAAEAVIAGKSS